MARLKAGDGLSAISASALQRAFDATASGRLDARPGNDPKRLPYTKAVGKNETGYAIKPGAPILLGEFIPDDEDAAFSGRIPGYFKCWPAFLPLTAANRSEIAGNLCDANRVAIALEAAEDDALFDIAIDGVVQASFDTTNAGPYASLLSNASGTTYRDKIGANTIAGFARIITRLDAKATALIQFGVSAETPIFIRTIGAIAAGASGSAYLQLPISTGWEPSAITVPVWAFPTGIPAEVDGIALPIDRRWAAFEVQDC
ncbi:MAG: hypothetical protein ABL921_21350 [Pirellula sp.]